MEIVDKKNVWLFEKVWFSTSHNFTQPLSILFIFISPSLLSSSSMEREERKERKKEGKER